MSLNKSQALDTAKQYVLKRQLDAAIEIYREIVEADPADLAAINTLGDLYASTGRVQDAITQFSRVADGYLAGCFWRKAIATLKKIVAADPDNIEAAIKLADLYSKADLPIEARQQYLQIADAYTCKGQTLEALRVHGKIVALDPTNASTRIKLGELCLREGMNDQAYEAFVMAAAQLTSKGESRRALNAYKEALAARPDSVEARAAVAKLIRALGLEPDKGPRNVSSQSVEPDEPHNRSEESSHVTSTSEPSPAPLPPVQHAEARDSGFVVQEISKAEFLVAYGKVENAITMLKDVLRGRPDDIDVHIKLKDIYLRTGMMAEAAQECEKLARIHDDLGDADRARDYAIRAKRLCQLIDNHSGESSDNKAKSSENAQPKVHTTPANVGSETSGTPKAPEVTNTLDPIRKQLIETATASEIRAKLVEAQPPTPRLKLVCEDQPKPAAAEAELASQLNLVCEQQPQPPAAEMAFGAHPVYDRIIDEKSLQQAGSTARPLPALFAKSSPSRKKQGHYTSAVAAMILLALGLVAVIAGFLYNNRLDKQYQNLASAAPPLSFPSLPEPVSEEPEPAQPDEPMTVVGTPQPQPSLPTKTQKPEADVIKTEQPTPSIVPAVESPKVTPRLSPSPPRTAISPDNHTTGEDHTPAGVPSGVPVAVARPAELPPITVRQSPSVVIGGAVKRVEPAYPLGAKTARQTGVVTVEVTINEQGNVASARAISGPPLLREAAVSAARGWKFKPSTRAGLPVVTHTTIVFNFKL